MASIPASVQQPANTITAIKTFMVTFLQCSFSVSSSSRLTHSTGAAFNINIALTNIRSHAVPTVNLYLLLMNNPVPVSLLSGDRKPQIRFLGNHHSGSGNLYHKSFRM